MTGALLSRFLTITVAVALLLYPSFAAAGCFIIGHISGQVNTTAPQYGAWKYTMNVTWDTGTRYALSHFNLFLDEGTNTCTCSGIDAALHWVNPMGSAPGVPSSCPVFYNGSLECHGDPSTGYPGIMIKFEPVPSASCQPSTTGNGSFVFYSNYPPAPIALNNLFLTDKAGLTSCSGMLTGFFPGLPCDPTETQDSTWGSLKSLYN